MIGQTFKGQKGTYIISRELGKGGEGRVFDLQNNSSLVLKIYNEALEIQKLQKLRFMTSMNASEFQTFAAWPIDIIIEGNDRVIGFTMKKLNNYVPLHMLFSPMDRKRLFPDKGYNFLIHVARNLASAFFKLHQAGIVIGDVNEGNILINSSGMVAFIDCDSFQIKDGSKYHFCEVGVPRYTPPELLLRGSFEKVIRTANTDSFSLAILIFQLLFLGRHPYAGKNASKDDIDEEAAIKNHQFAYSLKNKEKRLWPPTDSFEITNLSNSLIESFHLAFETKENRPPPRKWAVDLELFSKEFANCATSKIHSYPKKMKECPWCYFNKTKGIIYFIDDSYLKHNPIGDISHFVNGFKIEPLQFAKLPLSYTQTDLKADQIDSKFKNYKAYTSTAYLLTIITFAALCFVNLWFIAPGLFLLASMDGILPYNKKTKEELKKRNVEFNTLKSQFDLLVKEYNNPTDLTLYNKSLTQFNNLINNFKNLPIEFLNKRKQIEETLYNDQLHFFLTSFEIRKYGIPSFGPAKKQTLYKNGIQNASDISKLNSLRIYGIGPSNIQILLSWQRQFISKFIYKPDNNKLNGEVNKISVEIANKRAQLESLIRKDYQSIQVFRNSILHKQNSLGIRIKTIVPRVYKAELNYLEFKKIA